MARLVSLVKAIIYKLRYGRHLYWDGLLRCQKVAEIKILRGVLRIGRGFSMNPGSYIAIVGGGETVIGKNVAVNRNSMIICHKSIHIGDYCSIGPNVLIYDHDHKFGSEGLMPGYRTSPVVIENNCWIGGAVTILRGTVIGEGSIIGAGCVVQGVIPPHSLVTAGRSLNVVSLENR